MRLLIPFLCCVFFTTNVYTQQQTAEQQQTAKKIKAYQKKLQTLHRAVARLDREIVLITKNVRKLKKQQSALATSTVKQQKGVSPSTDNAILQNMKSQIAVLQKITVAMKDSSPEDLQKYNEQLQLESKKMQRMIQVKKQINSELTDHQQKLTQHKKLLVSTSKKIQTYKGILRKKIRQRSLLQKSILIYKKQAHATLQEHMAQSTESDNEHKVAAYTKKAQSSAVRKSKIRNIPDLEEEAVALTIAGTAAGATAVASQLNDEPSSFRGERRKNNKDGAWMVQVGSMWVYEKPITNDQYWQVFRKMFYNNANKNASAVTEITYEDAQAYAKWAGASLMTYKQLKQLPASMLGNHWEWTATEYNKPDAHVIFTKSQQPRLLADATEHEKVTFRLMVPVK